MRISFLPAQRISFLLAHAHLFYNCACASHFGLRVRISFWSSRAHLFLACACAFTFLSAHAHLILACVCASHLVLRMRISSWPAHGLGIFTCPRASHFDLHMRISFTPARVQLILSFALAFVLPAHELFFLCSVCSYHFALPVGLAISDC